MPFPKNVRETALVKSRRRCCVCHNFIGRNANVHHIKQEADGGSNALENAIVLCLRCHAEAGHYNPKHPLGTKYAPSELIKHRDNWWKDCESLANKPIISDIEITYKRTFISQDIHKHRLIVLYTNSFEKAHSSFRIELLMPAKVPVKVEGFDVHKNIRIENEFYTKIAYQAEQTIYPDQTKEIIGINSNRLEYEMNHSLFFMPGIDMWVLKWRFYTSNSPMIEGEVAWNKLHSF